MIETRRCRNCGLTATSDKWFPDKKVFCPRCEDIELEAITDDVHAAVPAMMAGWTGAEMLDRIRASLRARLEGRTDGGDVEVMQLVDRIVAAPARVEPQHDYVDSLDNPHSPQRACKCGFGQPNGISHSELSLHIRAAQSAKQIYVAHIDDIPTLTTANHEIVDPVSPDDVVRMWDALKTYAEKQQQSLQDIADWKLPETGHSWPSGGKVSYEAEYGSNGVRDYIRGVARAGLERK